ncbi:ligase-associated DNA damage response DEXH box helicase [Sandaracinobacteroides saxicola]|nr:ligase-associated DNA damage response DEXH box helicase [Sandaracinobacteroides saxicola]
MLEAAHAGEHALLVAATGAGKTLSGFLPVLADLIERPGEGLRALYVSPLKALAADVARNLLTPIADMGLDIRVETRTGDTSSDAKKRQREKPPHILLTTPESLSLLLTWPDSATMLAGLDTVIIDEIHAFAPTKRGDLLALALARLQKLNPRLRRVALSATIPDERGMRGWLAPGGNPDAVRLVTGEAAALPDIGILIPDGRIPWSGHNARHAAREVVRLIERHRLSIVFVNTRAVAELVFRDLWAENEAALPIGIHHGSLAPEARQKTEAAMAAGRLRAVVATASLDLGIDWGDVDLVVQMGAPKGASRMVQRVGRANHRMDEASKAVIVPGNRFEYLESLAAYDAVMAGDLDGDPFRPGGLDVLAQHLMGVACAEPFEAGTMHAEISSAAPYAGVSRATFDRVLELIATGGYALRVYDRFRRLVQGKDGRWRVTHPRLTAAHRLNAGVIVEAPAVKVRFGSPRAGGKALGTIEEWFAAQLRRGDRFMFAGLTLEVVANDGPDLVVRMGRGNPSVPAYVGGRMPMTTNLADRVRAMLPDRAQWARMPDDVHEWLALQAERSIVPAPDQLLVETFPRDGRWHMVLYGFEGRNAHQSLGMVVTQRMEAQGLQPLGFVATDYVLSVWGLREVTNPLALLHPDILESEFAAWIEGTPFLKRAFRDVAVISGLIERTLPGQAKTGKQVMFSTDLIFDVLRRHEPGHLLLEAAWADAHNKLTDLPRLEGLLRRAQTQLLHVPLERVSPLAVPVMLEISKEMVTGLADEALLEEAAALAAEAA